MSPRGISSSIAHLKHLKNLYHLYLTHSCLQLSAPGLFIRLHGFIWRRRAQLIRGLGNLHIPLYPGLHSRCDGEKLFS